MKLAARTRRGPGTIGNEASVFAKEINVPIWQAGQEHQGFKGPCSMQGLIQHFAKSVLTAPVFNLGSFGVNPLVTKA